LSKQNGDLGSKSDIFSREKAEQNVIFEGDVVISSVPEALDKISSSLVNKK